MRDLAKITPFRGIIYNQKKVGDLSKVVAPPYDTISYKQQEQYYQTSKYNVVRLILGKESPGDRPWDNKYTRAAQYLKDWLEKDVLKRDNHPAIYTYDEQFMLEEESRHRWGFIALLKLEEFTSGKVLPHERTLPGPKADRLRLMQTTQANLCQVLGLYSDPQKETDKLLESPMETEPLINITDENNIKHRLWRATNSELIDKLTQLMKDKTIYIADGHHRYETALNYQREMREKTKDRSGKAPFDYVMVMLVNMDREGLIILPTHRLIKKKDFHPAKLEHQIMQYFDIEAVPLNRLLAQMRARGEESHTFGVYLGERQSYLLTLRSESILDKLLGPTHSKEWRRLDVVILQTLLIEHILAIDSQKPAKSAEISFTEDEMEAKGLVDEGRYQVAFFLNPTKIEQVKKIADQREKMPQKSTYFYPKLLSGLVINKLEW